MSFAYKQNQVPTRKDNTSNIKIMQNRLTAGCAQLWQPEWEQTKMGLSFLMNLRERRVILDSNQQFSFHYVTIFWVVLENLTLLSAGTCWKAAHCKMVLPT